MSQVERATQPSDAFGLLGMSWPRLASPFVVFPTLVSSVSVVIEMMMQLERGTRRGRRIGSIPIPGNCTAIDLLMTSRLIICGELSFRAVDR